MVECFDKDKKLVHRNMHKQIIPKKQTNGNPFPKRGEDDLNVVTIAFESISRLIWLRHAPEIHDYLTGTIILSKNFKVLVSNSNT